MQHMKISSHFLYFKFQFVIFYFLRTVVSYRRKNDAANLCINNHFNTVYIAERSDDYDSQEETNFW